MSGTTESKKVRSPTSLRFTEDQEEYLEFLVNFVETDLNVPVTKTWIIKKLMNDGRESFHRQFNISEEDLGWVDFSEKNEKSD